MKKLLRLTMFFSALFLINNLQAQLPDGSIAPDWTLTDLDGNTHSLYSDYLDQGKHVVLDFSATWCGPCWTYHNTGNLETLWEEYGPDGSDEIMVFFIEADTDTNTACLYGSGGCVGGTQGDWVSGTGYPIIDLQTNEVYNDYQIGYFPTLYAVSATNKTVWEVGQAPVSTWENWLFNSFALAGNGAITDAICAGEGQIEQSTTGGQGNVSWEWSNGSYDESIYDISEGYYYCTLTDNNGYFYEEEYYVQGPSSGQPFELAISDIQDVLCFGDDNGSLTAAGSGGNGGIEYEWSTGEYGETIQNLSPGFYTVTATDAQGCELIETQEVEGPLFYDTETYPVDESCGNQNGSVSFVTFGGTFPYTYEVDGIGFNSSGDFDGLASGTYYYTVSDFNSCLINGEFTIESVGGPTAMASANEDITCAVTEVTVSGEGSDEGGDITYSWTTMDGNIVSGADQKDAMVDMPGTYVIEVYNTATDCGETAEVTVMADEVAPVAMSAVSEMLTCATTEVMVDGSGSSEGDDFTYEWTTSDGTIESGSDELMATVSATGTYVLKVTNNANGCVMESSVMVEENVEEPSISVTDAVLTCTTTEVQICADVEEGLTVVWQLPGGDVEGDCAMVSTAGSFTAKVTGMNGCEATAESTVSVSDDLPQVSANPNDNLTCVVEEVELSAELDGENGDYNISWNDDQGEMIASDELNVTVTNPGVYTLVVENKDNGCTTEIEYSVDEIIVDPIAGFDSDLEAGSLALMSTSDGEPSMFSWDFGNGMTSTEENPTVDLGETGVYNICLTITNDCGEDTKCEDVQFVSVLLVNASYSNISCYGENNGTASVDVSGGLPDYMYLWTDASGVISDQPSVDGLAPGEYYVEVSDAFGSVKNGTVTITEPVDIVENGVDITDTPMDEAAGSITVDISGGTGDLTFEWSNGMTGSTVEGLEAGEYSVVVTDDNGCSREFGPYVVKSVSSVGDISILQSFEVYPNPTVGDILVDIELEETLEGRLNVTDIYGSNIESMRINDKDMEIRIDLSNNPSGIYFVNIISDRGVASKKVILVK